MKWKNGFYFDEKAPAGAVELTDERYEELLAGQAQGLTIEECDGIPILIDQRLSEQQIEKNIEYQENKKRLSDLTEDFAQSFAGAVIPNLDQRRDEFLELLDKVRKYEGKEPRAREEVL